MGWVTVAAMVASAALSYAAQSQMERRQKKLTNAMEAYRREKYGEGQAAIKGFMDTINPQARAEERATINAELEQGLTDSVGAVRKFEAPQQIAGKVSDDFDARTASNNMTIADRIRRAVGQLAIMGGPAETQLRESHRLARAAGVVDATNAAANNVSAAYMQGIQSQRPDPFLTLGSQLASGVGMAGASGAFGGASAGGVQTLGAGGLGLKMPTTARPGLGLRF